jgi:flagellar basal body rod protein FlgG
VAEGGLLEGSLEHSGADAVQDTTTLVTSSREFEMITKVIEAFSQVARKVATDIASSR